MKMFGLVIGITALSILPVSARAPKFEALLRHLDPATRFEQICSLEAMKKIADDSKSYSPDRAMVDAVSRPTITDTTMQGAGGAFRSGGRWYQFSFTCRTSTDHLTILGFRYEIGAAIPEAEWGSYGLWH